MKQLLTIVSLTLLVAGSVNAEETKGQGHGFMRQRMEAALEKLPKEKAEMVRNSMKQAMQANKTTFERRHAIKEELNAIMTADRFDKKAYLAKMKELSVLKQDMATRRAEAMADAYAKLSKEERKILAGSYPRPNRHGGGTGGGEPDDKGESE